MSQYILSKNLRFNNAEQFKESFYESLDTTVGYVFIGNHIPYANSDTEILDIIDSEYQQRSCWDNMIAAKKITGNDLELVVPNVEWESGVTYNQYDDNIALDGLLNANSNSMYVVANSSVYKCLSNNYSIPSTSQPSGEGTNGTVITADLYVWKYLYKIPEFSSFTSNTWIPVPISANKLEYSANTNYAIPGEITTVVIDNGGSGYYNNNINVSSFVSACTVLTYDFLSSVFNTLAINMELSGDGIESGTYITNIDAFYRKITLSTPTISSGGGSGNSLFVFSRTIILGDGSNAIANTSVANGQVEKITLTNFGESYNYANVVIYGTGDDASARAIISPCFGHGCNPAKELGAHNVMINMNFNSDESGVISTDTTYRQYGFLRNPYKYNEESAVDYSNATTVISQTTDVTLVESVAYQENEFVYQGTLSNPFFSGIVNTIEANNIIKLTNVKGIPVVGTVLKGSTEETSTGRTVFDITYPEFTPYTGEVLYVKNVLPIQRTVDQIENIKFIVKF